jgi:hypothetical protein
MSIARASGLLAVVFALAGGCAAEHANKNTNWLSLCSSSADCGDADCTCGICTKTCTATTDCAGSEAACAPSFASTGQCSGTEQPGLCLQACSSSADCAEDRLCLGGACVVRVQSLCAGHPDAAACSGFDKSVPTGWTDASTAGNEITTSKDPRFAGASSLSAHISGSGDRSRLLHEFPSISSGSLYLRAWLYMDPGTVLNDVHSIVVGDADTGDYGTKFLYSNGKLRVATPTLDVTGDVDPPFGRWYCLRLELDVGGAGSVRAYLDDEMFAEQANVNTLPAAGVHNISAGIDFAGQAEPAQLQVDELLLDTQPVDCWQ